MTSVARSLRAKAAEMLSSINSSEAPGEADVVHSLVARMEGRLAVLLATRDDELSEGQRRIESMVERLALMVLVHTPEVPEETPRWRRHNRWRRYTNYRKAVRNLPAKNDPERAEDCRPTAAEASRSTPALA